MCSESPAAGLGASSRDRNQKHLTVTPIDVGCRVWVYYRTLQKYHPLNYSKKLSKELIPVYIAYRLLGLKPRHL